MKRGILCLAAAVMLLFCGCGQEKSRNEELPHATKEIFAMDTYMTVTAYGQQAEAAVTAARKEIQRLDALLSVGDKESEISRINAVGKGVLSEDSQKLLEKSRWIYENTDGAYDITVYPLMKLWGFFDDRQAVPAQEEIDRVLTDSGFDKLYDDNGNLQLGKGQGIDFGGIAKGYAGDRIMQIFGEYDIVSGVISLGGNVQCFGSRTDGEPWRCGVTDPDHPEDSGSLLGVVRVSDKAVITSGGYERFFIENGKTYHHIMNPATGYPAESGLRSVTIVSRDGTLADGLSTACFVMGKEKAVSFWKQHFDEFDMILLTEDNELFITGGIQSSFTSDRGFMVITAG